MRSLGFAQLIVSKSCLDRDRVLAIVVGHAWGKGESKTGRAIQTLARTGAHGAGAQASDLRHTAGVLPVSAGVFQPQQTPTLCQLRALGIGQRRRA